MRRQWDSAAQDRGKILSAEQVNTAVAHENMCLQCFEYIEYKVKHGDGYVYWFCDKNLFM